MELIMETFGDIINTERKSFNGNNKIKIYFISKYYNSYKYNYNESQTFDYYFEKNDSKIFCKDLSYKEFKHFYKDKTWEYKK